MFSLAASQYQTTMACCHSTVLVLMHTVLLRAFSSSFNYIRTASQREPVRIMYPNRLNINSTILHQLSSLQWSCSSKGYFFFCHRFWIPVQNPTYSQVIDVQRPLPLIPHGNNILTGIQPDCDMGVLELQAAKMRYGCIGAADSQIEIWVYRICRQPDWERNNSLHRLWYAYSYRDIYFYTLGYSFTATRNRDPVPNIHPTPLT